MEEARKRKRANSNGDAHQTPTQSATPISSAELAYWLDTIKSEDNGERLRRILFSVATQLPAVADLVRREHDALVERKRVQLETEIDRKRTQVINFDTYSKDVWHSINQNYGRGTKAYEASFEVCAETEETVRFIGETAGDPHASFGTKRSGMETLRKIGKTICLSGDVVGREVRKHFQSDNCLEEAMLCIVKTMTDLERDDMCAVDDGRSSFEAKMQELVEEASGYCIMGKLGAVIEELTGGAFNEEEDNEDEEEEEDEDGAGEEEEEEEEEDTSAGHHNIYRDPQFKSDAEEMAFLEQYDSCGAYRGPGYRRSGRSY